MSQRRDCSRFWGEIEPPTLRSSSDVASALFSPEKVPRYENNIPDGSILNSCGPSSSSTTLNIRSTPMVRAPACYACARLRMCMYAYVGICVGMLVHRVCMIEGVMYYISHLGLGISWLIV